MWGDRPVVKRPPREAQARQGVASSKAVYPTDLGGGPDIN
jgi:hypothetical protein